jgi:hypothetical protein
MTTQVENHQLPVEIGLPKGDFQGFTKAKDFFTQTVNTLTESAQQAKHSLTTTTHAAVDTVTTVTSDSVKTIKATTQQGQASLGEIIEQTKGSLEQTLQTTEQLKITTSGALQTAISSSISDWLQAHPVAFRLVQLLIWATNHPIVSLVILLFAIAIAWSLIKAFGRLIETVGWLLLQTPFKLGQVLIGVGFKSLGKVRGLAVNQLAFGKTAELPALQNSSSKPIQQDKQQRLAEISTRLEVIRQEQNELLQEVAAILASDKYD